MASFLAQYSAVLASWTNVNTNQTGTKYAIVRTGSQQDDAQFSFECYIDTVTGGTSPTAQAAVIGGSESAHLFGMVTGTASGVTRQDDLEYAKQIPAIIQGTLVLTGSPSAVTAKILVRSNRPFSLVAAP